MLFCVGVLEGWKVCGCVVFICIFNILNWYVYVVGLGVDGIYCWIIVVLYNVNFYWRWYEDKVMNCGVCGDVGVGGGMGW